MRRKDSGRSWRNGSPSSRGSERAPSRGAPRLRVRRARPADLRDLTHLWIELARFHSDRFGPEYRLARGSQSELRKWLSGHIGTRGKLSLLAEADGKPVGFLVAAIQRPQVFAGGPYGHIFDVYVRPSSRRMGIGKTLVNEALEWLRNRRARRVRIHTDARNDSSIKFWRAMGFRPAMIRMDRNVPRR